MKKSVPNENEPTAPTSQEISFVGSLTILFLNVYFKKEGN